MATGRAASNALVAMAIVNTQNVAIGHEIYAITGWNEALVHKWLSALEWPGQRTNLRFQRERRSRQNANPPISDPNPNPMDAPC